MNFRSSAIDIAAIRTDGGTQVRESLDEEYVAELAILFTENRQGVLPAVVAFRDGDGAVWLADGFHRHAAAVRSESQSLVAEVREGSLDDAKLYAAGANTRNGMRLNSGDKKRAILLADTTARKAGKAMGVREIARLVGCDVAHASRVLGGEVLTCQQSQELGTHLDSKRAALYLRVDGALTSNPTAPDTSIAKQVACSPEVVAKRRLEMGIQPVAKGAHRAKVGEDNRKRVAEYLSANPESSLRKTVDVLKVGSKTVAQVRDSLGLAKAKPGPTKGSPPSAPITRPDDARIGSDEKVILAYPSPATDSRLADAKRAVEALNDSELDSFTQWFQERAFRNSELAAE